MGSSACISLYSQHYRYVDVEASPEQAIEQVEAEARATSKRVTRRGDELWIQSRGAPAVAAPYASASPTAEPDESAPPAAEPDESASPYETAPPAGPPYESAQPYEGAPPYETAPPFAPSFESEVHVAAFPGPTGARVLFDGADRGDLRHHLAPAAAVEFEPVSSPWFDTDPYVLEREPWLGDVVLGLSPTRGFGDGLRTRIDVSAFLGRRLLSSHGDDDGQILEDHRRYRVWVTTGTTGVVVSDSDEPGSEWHFGGRVDLGLSLDTRAFTKPIAELAAFPLGPRLALDLTGSYLWAERHRAAEVTLALRHEWWGGVFVRGARASVPEVTTEITGGVTLDHTWSLSSTALLLFGLAVLSADGADE